MAFEHLLVAVDFGPASERAADLAVAIASKFGSKLDLVHAFYIPPLAYGDGMPSYVPYDDLLRDAQKALDEARARIQARYPSAEAVLVDGEPRLRIVEVAAERGADLILVGTHGRRGLSRVLFGSVAERILRTSPVPVLTTGPREPGKDAGGAPFHHVLAPTDFGDPAERAVVTAAAMAKAFDAKLTLVHAYAMPATIYDERMYWPTNEIVREAEAALEGAVARTKQRYPVVDSVLVCGDPRERILEVARERNADLIVMGTHGRHGLSRVFLGSVAENVVRTSPVPVLTLGAHTKGT